ncbi:MAG: response regulator [Lachnospiraceae bacterium]|nr:response regulator [Lachnospiraceae bacterium]
MDKQKKILVVDDDQNMLQLLYSFLRDSYRVTMVSSGKDALESLRKQKPDLMLLDYLMPEMNGKETLEIIRNDENLKDLPVFFLTGVSDSNKISECLKLDPSGYILKPIGKFSLLAKIRAYFEESELDRL